MKRTLVVIALTAAPPLLADVVHLRGGGQIEGQIVEQTEDSVTVDIGAGEMGVKMSSVVRIEKTESPLQQYRARSASLAPDDVEGWRELARWAGREGLMTQSREAWSKVVAVAPDDADANRALGRVQLDGRWVSEEESYQARGFVEFEGEWVTPEERQAILEHRAARQEADRQAVAAQIEADDAAAREREARKEAEWDAFGNDLPGLGDPLYWGYGYGPTYWPATPVTRPDVGRPGRPAQLPARGRR